MGGCLASPAVDLVGTAEIADLLGVTRQRAWQITAEGGFPAPVAVLSAGKFWRKSDVERWAHEQGRFLRHDTD